MADSLRSTSGMEANEFKDYILGLIFYRYISEHQVNEFNEKLHISVKDFYKEDPRECRNAAIESLALGYFIEPEYLFENLVIDIVQGKFEIKKIADAFKNYSDSTKGKESEEELSNLFNDVNLASEKLGKTYKDKGELIAKLIKSINNIDFKFLDSQIDVLGDAYEYLIGQFAASGGKKAGEFYTPQQVSKLLSLIVTENLEKVKFISDPTCGSGSLLIQVANKLKEKNIDFAKIYGQELKTNTCNLAKMNLLVHSIDFNKFSIYQSDTLKHPSEDQKEYGKMDIVVANPPFSAI